ncbi:Holliday junction ATP-dependent DNA helicase RuvA [Fulvitalea axinellae]|uniref:Holliday junction branch migration complex subunit RuvA n=1 Tax=Fulvitalea axinellae TaxID=1182444 RepID=A0AAU9DDP0_9BACT|nr:Holliday junction ATP-dependent DNA helicase RuvA [Fulvitalea axinellae]
MIAYLKGALAHKEPAFVIVDVGGMGYEVRISLNTYAALKNEESYKLVTYLHVKEDAQILYGFSEGSEKRLFMQLIGISGVGPNTALTILSSMDANDLKRAIVSEDAKTVQSVKGIGAKTAQRIILELKDKLAKEGFDQKVDAALGVAHYAVKEDALTALTTLGIAKATAEKSIDTILKKAASDITTEEVIKLALKAR